MNDYGFELLAPKTYPMAELLEDHSDLLLNTDHLERDLEAALNLSELQRRRFRAIAQVAGLMHRGFPGSGKSTGQLQISASLLFDVFERHEPQNRLLLQARREVLDEQLELSRLEAALQRACTAGMAACGNAAARPPGLPAAGGAAQQPHEQRNRSGTHPEDAGGGAPTGAIRCVRSRC